MRSILVSILFCVLISSTNTAQINTERFRKDADTTGFSGNTDFEATIITGNTDFQFLSLGGRLNYNWGDAYTFLVFDGGLGWNKGESFFDQSLIHIRNVFTINDFLQQETFVQYDFNKKRKLLDRDLIGTGLRFKLIKEGAFKFRVGLGYMFELEGYDLPDNSLHGNKIEVHRITSYTTFEIELKHDVRLLSVTYYQPEIGKLNDYKIVSENSLIVELGKFIDFNVKFNLRYDSRPPDDTKELDTMSKFGVSLKF